MSDSVRKALLEKLKTCSLDFVEYLEYLVSFHKKRSILSSRERELIILSSLINQGSPEKQITMHYRAALDVGITKNEIAELIIQVSLYSGMPSAVNAMQLLAEFLE